MSSKVGGRRTRMPCGPRCGGHVKAGAPAATTAMVPVRSVMRTAIVVGLAGTHSEHIYWRSENTCLGTWAGQMPHERWVRQSVIRTHRPTHLLLRQPKALDSVVSSTRRYGQHNIKLERGRTRILTRAILPQTWWLGHATSSFASLLISA